MPGKCKFANWPLIHIVQFYMFAYDGFNGKFYSSSMLLPVGVVATSPPLRISATEASLPGDACSILHPKGAAVRVAGKRY